MKAGYIIGRVGGLAIALGVGAVIFGGSSVAWADDSTPAEGASASSDRPHNARVHAATAATRSPRGIVNQRSAEPKVLAPKRLVGPAESAVVNAISSQRHSPRDLVVNAVDPAVASAAVPLRPDGPITTVPAVVWREGILRGTVGASSAAGLPLTYTVIDGPSLGGKLHLVPVTDESAAGDFSYLPYSTTLTDSALNEQFSILVAETTAFDIFISRIPILGLFVSPLLTMLHQVPILNSLLVPIIGNSKVVQFNENPYSLAAGDPVAFTYLMPSFDGTGISVNYFPAVDVATGAAPTATTVLNGPGLLDPGNTDPDSLIQDAAGRTPGLLPLRTDQSPGGYDGGGGFNVITWDPRGRFASGGVLQLNSPFWEGRDVTSIISWATSESNPAHDQLAMESENDPLIGMVGASYGGGIQLVSAGTPDRRIDAIVPSLAWNSFMDSLYPNGAFKTAYAAMLTLGLTLTGATINSQIYPAVASGILLGFLSQSAVALFADSGPTILVNNIDIPTQYIQGTTDGLFPLEQVVANLQQMAAANPDAPVAMTWICGGHAPCLDPVDSLRQDEFILVNSLKWLDQYVAGSGTPADSIPKFQWFDQKGDLYTSDLMPFDTGFNDPTPLTYQSAGGLLGLLPLIGGSGPQNLAPVVNSITMASEARNALNVDAPLPVGTQIAGAPNLGFTYTGLGTGRFVYAQLVDDATGRVVGNINTAVPVTLDGRQHTVDIPMEYIAYTVHDARDALRLQITSSATAYENFTAFGVINISNISLDLPTVAQADR